MPVYNDALVKVPELQQIADHEYANVVKTGQLGVGHDLRTIDACTPLALPSLVPVVVHVPNMFRKVPNMPEMLKDIITRHSKTATGLEITYAIEDGEGFNFRDSQAASVPTRATRSPITPSFTFPEYNGQIIYNFFKNWQEMIIHPDTQFSKLSSYINDEELDPFVYSWFCMDILWIQFDITWLPKNIIDGFLTINMYPRTIGALTYKKDVNAGHEIPERTVEFHAILKHDVNTLLLAKKVASMLNMHKTNYNLAPNPIDEDYEQTVQMDAGMKAEMDQILADWKLFE